jgi:hypothetical protein
MKYAMYAVLVLAGCVATVQADSWSFPKKLIKKEFEFGDTKLVLEIDGTKNQGYPPHTLSIYSGDELVAKCQNIGFEKIYASDDNKFFVGVSNSGIPGTAFVIFDADGKLLREEKHRFLPRELYTARSITLVRAWFDEENPDVKFEVSEGRLSAVFIRGSNKQKYNLMEPDIGFREEPRAR